MEQGRPGDRGNKVLLWDYPLRPCTLTPACSKLVTFTCLVERSLCSKSWNIHIIPLILFTLCCSGTPTEKTIRSARLCEGGTIRGSVSDVDIGGFNVL